MNVDELITEWRQIFGPVPPIGYLCREAFPERWLRIHSLPGSKRYADDESEYAELLRRHNDVASTILGNDEPCALFVTDEVDDDPWSHVTVTRVAWRPGAFDTLIRDVADERAGRVLVANFARRAAYAPYDGGADLFVDSPGTVRQLKNRWRAWLSARHDGL